MSSREYIEKMLEAYHAETPSDSDTMYEPSRIDDDTDSELSVISEGDSEDDIPSDVPPLTMSEINNMPTIASKEGIDCLVCTDVKYDFVIHTCCSQSICKDCTMEWLLITGKCMFCKENLFIRWAL